jgi:hypothetical protein
MMKLLDISAQINGQIKEALAGVDTSLNDAREWFNLIGAKDKVEAVDKAREIINPLLEEAKAEKTSWS